MSLRRNLIIMLKEARPGRVKTRLAADIGKVEATWWFRHQSHKLVRTLSRDARWTTTIALSPDVAVHGRSFPFWASRRSQGRGDLGQRMQRQLAASVPGPVVLIGSDIPGVTPQTIATAFAALKSHDAVFGPAPDGGYWLVGLRNAHLARPSLFANVRWSCEHTLTDSLNSLGSDMRVAFTKTMRDVDSQTDLAHIPSPGFPKKAFRTDMRFTHDKAVGLAFSDQ